MSEADTFSGRTGLRPVRLVHDAAPIGFRHAVIGALRAEIIESERLIGIVQRGTTLPRPNSFLTEAAVMPMIEQSEWWRVFDVAELGHSAIASLPYTRQGAVHSYERAINEACVSNGIGWRMENGSFVVQASSAEHDHSAQVSENLLVAGFATSAGELREANADLSRRPVPDISGAMQHAGAALECLARDLTGDPRLTLGEIIKRHETLFPGAYRKLAEAIWGIVSNHGRHLREGGLPSLEEALFVVGAVTSLTGYLVSAVAVSGTPNRSGGSAQNP